MNPAARSVLLLVIAIIVLTGGCMAPPNHDIDQATAFMDRGRSKLEGIQCTPENYQNASWNLGDARADYRTALSIFNRTSPGRDGEKRTILINRKVSEYNTLVLDGAIDFCMFRHDSSEAEARLAKNLYDGARISSDFAGEDLNRVIGSYQEALSMNDEMSRLDYAKEKGFDTYVSSRQVLSPALVQNSLASARDLARFREGFDRYISARKEKAYGDSFFKEGDAGHLAEQYRLARADVRAAGDIFAGLEKESSDPVIRQQAAAYKNDCNLLFFAVDSYLHFLNVPVS